MDLATAKRVTPWLDDAFFHQFVALSDRQGISPYDLALVLISESGLKPTAYNPNAPTAHGIFQAIPSTLHQVGWHQSPDEFRTLSANEQLPYLEQYISNLGRSSWPSAAFYYWGNFLPLTLGRADGIVASANASDGRERAAYNSNSGFDRQGKGYISIDDLARHLNVLRPHALYQAIATRIADLQPLVAPRSSKAWLFAGAALAFALGAGGYMFYRTYERKIKSSLSQLS